MPSPFSMPRVVASRLSFLPAALSWITLVAGLGTLALAILLCLWTYSPLPCVDDWYFVHQFHSYVQGRFSLFQLLWSIHNDHRILIPHIFHLLDLTLFRGTNAFLLFSIFAAQLAHVSILASLNSRLANFRGSSHRFALGFILFCLFCPVQRENFTCGWEIAYILPFLFASLAISALATYAASAKKGSSSGWLATSVGAAVLGTYSLASGILIFPILLLQAIALRLSKMIIITAALLSAVVCCVKLLDPPPENPHVLTSAFNHYRQVGVFFTDLFSRSWSTSGEIPGAAFSMMLVVAIAFLFFRALVLGRTNAYVVALLCISMFAALNAGMTAAARWELGIAGRYETPVYLFWCAAGLLALYHVNLKTYDRGLVIFESLFLIAIVASLGGIRPLRSEATGIGDAYRMAQAALGSQVFDGDAVQIVNMPTGWTFGELSFLAKRRASLYAVQPTSAVGQDLSAIYKVSNVQCPGRIERTSWLPDDSWPGISVFGRLAQASSQDQEWIILTDASRKIVGFGSSSQQTFPSDTSSAHQVGRSWKGFVPAAAARGNLFAFALSGEQSICEINASEPIRPPQGPDSFDISEQPELEEVWRPNAGNVSVVGGSTSISSGTLLVHSSTTDTQLVLTSNVNLGQFQTLVLKAKFERKDSVELFFSQQINGRGLAGYTKYPNQWVYVFAQVGRNRFWKSEAGKAFRFDPTGGLGPGAVTQISAVWGSRKPIAQGPDMVEFAVARNQTP